jgi:DNA polymerase-3 subunit alpha
MKANHPVAFIAACMDLAISNTDKIAALRQEAQRMRVPMLPPDINRSDARFKVEIEGGRECIRYALAAIKKVGLEAMSAVVAARGDTPFADLADFAARVDPRCLNKMQLENLARAGAFDALHQNRQQVFAGAELILRRAQADAEEAQTGQTGLFAGAGAPDELRLPPGPDWPGMERLGYEADAIGFHLTSHPLDSYAPLLKRLGVVASKDLDARAAAGATRVKVAGCVIASKERTTRTGSRMAWIRLSDGGGSFEVTVFSEVLNAAREWLKSGAAVLMSVDLKLEGDNLRITAADCTGLDAAASAAGAGMRIWLDRTEAVPHIRAILSRGDRGRGRITLVPRLDTAQAVEIILPGGFQVTPRLAQAIKTLPGVERVEEI